MLIFLNTNIYLLKFSFDFDLGHFISTQFSVFLLECKSSYESLTIN